MKKRKLKLKSKKLKESSGAIYRTEEYFISGKELIPLDFLNKSKNSPLVKGDKGGLYYINRSLVKEYNGPDKYSWRILGYDVQHTGYYNLLIKFRVFII